MLHTNEIDTNADGSTNSPANDFWSLNITYMFLNSQTVNNVGITFLPNGTIDQTRTSAADLQNANVLPSTVSPSNISTFWTKMNWIYVSLYWTVLYDLGQIAPTVYVNQSDTAIMLPSSNNIFINPSLFNTYSTILDENILPDQGYSLPKFSPVGQTNRLLPHGTTFLQSYSCRQRKRKELLSALISIMAADISFILFAYGCVTWLVETWEKRDKGPMDGKKKLSIFEDADFFLANYCIGCRKFAERASSNESIKYP